MGLGLIPGEGGTQLLPRRIGLNKAADLVLTGRRVDAEEALQLGLADRLVPEGAARSSALELAQQIAAKSPISLRAAKRALRQGIDVDLMTGLEIEDQAWEEAAFSADRLEGVEAFNLRRTPRLAELARERPMTEHPHQFPQPIELPVDERESVLPLSAQLTRFIITGGFSAIVDFGLAGDLDGARPGAHAGQGHLLHRRHDNGLSDQPALDVQSLSIDAPFRCGRDLVRVTFALQVGVFSVCSRC